MKEVSKQNPVGTNAISSVAFRLRMEGKPKMWAECQQQSAFNGPLLNIKKDMSPQETRSSYRQHEDDCLHWAGKYSADGEFYTGLILLEWAIRATQNQRDEASRVREHAYGFLVKEYSERFLTQFNKPKLSITASASDWLRRALPALRA